MSRDFEEFTVNAPLAYVRDWFTRYVRNYFIADNTGGPSRLQLQYPREAPSQPPVGIVLVIPVMLTSDQPPYEVVADNLPGFDVDLFALTGDRTKVTATRFPANDQYHAQWYAERPEPSGP